MPFPAAPAIATRVRARRTPLETLRKVLDDPAFDRVRQALSEVSTGPLAGYRFDPPAAAAKADTE